MTTPCPHCGWPTELTLEAPTAREAAVSRSRKWLVAGVVILLVGFIAAVGAVLVAQRLAKKKRASAALSRTNMGITNSAAAFPVRSRTKGAEIISNFSASDVRIDRSAGSSLIYARGTLQNETDKQRFDVTVELDLFDSADTKIGAAKDYKDVVEPHGQWTFRALVVPKNAVSARIAAIREQP